MGQKIDLNRLTSEIQTRKRERGIISEKVTGGSLLPKDEFLNGLLTSLQTGQSTKATNLIKLVENKTAEKFGEVVRHDVATISPTVVPNKAHSLNEVEMSPERDEQLWADIEKRKKQTLAESIEGFNKTTNAPMNNVPTYTGGQPINEGYLIENVKKIVNNYLIENFGPVIDEAIKSTIIEMYAVERIKEVLQENKEIIKTVVYETIRELQAKKKGQ
jgi:hypothetical protein